MDFNVMNKIRKTNIRYALFQFIYLIIVNFCCISLIYVTFISTFELGYIFISIIFLLVAIFFDIRYYKIINLAFFPQNSKIFKKYGSVKKVQEILSEISDTIVYEDKYLIISQNYIYDKLDLENLINFNDVQGVYKLIEKINFVTCGYKIKVVTNDGEIDYIFEGDEKLCDQLICLIRSMYLIKDVEQRKEKCEHIISELYLQKKEKMTNNKFNILECLILEYISIIFSAILLVLFILIFGIYINGVVALILVFLISILFYNLYYYMIVRR